MWAIFQQLVHDEAKIPNMVDRFDGITAYLDTNVTHFGQLMSGAKKDELSFVAI